MTYDIRHKFCVHGARAVASITSLILFYLPKIVTLIVITSPLDHLIIIKISHLRHVQQTIWVSSLFI